MVGDTVTHYKILRLLGRGGMGEVYEAEDTNLQRRIALKFLTAELADDPEAVRRFQREARMASALNHPHICIVHDIGESQGRCFIVTELLNGRTLQEMLASGPIAENQVYEFALQISDALAAAHDRKIIHRDLKPSNIFVTDEFQIKLLDFGLAKMAESSLPVGGDAPTKTASDLTHSGSLVGTFSYMSPEQLRNLPLGPASDVFSFGIVMCEMLTGAHPFAKGTAFETASSILVDAFPAKNRAGPPIPPTWLNILQKMLNKNLDERYSHAREVRTDLLALQSERLARSGEGIVVSSIAVLPFRNLSHDPDNEYFSDGLTEELINLLSNTGNLRVAARTSSFRFRGKELDVRLIGRELGVSSILDGSVQRSANRLRITGELVNATDGFQLWSGRYDREMSDVFALQDEIAHAVVANLQPTLIKEPSIPTARRRINPDAYNFYLQGRFFWNKRTAENFRNAISCFRKAIDLDNNFAAALAGIADSCITLAVYGAEPPDKVMSLARDAAYQALEIDPRLAEAHTSLGGVAALYDWNWGNAEQHFRHAIESRRRYATAHHWYATNCLLPQARFTEAQHQLEVARDLEPLSLAIATTWGFALFMQRQYDEAIEEFNRVIGMDPNFGLAHFFVGQVFAEKRMFEDAIRELQVSVELNEQSPESLAILGWAYARAGQTAQANKILLDLRDLSRSIYVSPILFSPLVLALGRKQEALEYLDQSRREHAADLIWLKVRPAFDDLRNEPRFIRLCVEIGLSANPLADPLH